MSELLLKGRLSLLQMFNLPKCMCLQVPNNNHPLNHTCTAYLFFFPPQKKKRVNFLLSMVGLFSSSVHIDIRSNPVMFLLADFEGSVIKDLLFRFSSESSLRCVKHLSPYFCNILNPLIVGAWILDRARQWSKNIPWIIIRQYEQMHFHCVTSYPAPYPKACMPQED